MYQMDPYGINSAAQVVGVGNTGGPSVPMELMTIPLYWSEPNNAPTTLPTGGILAPQCFGINDTDQVVGWGSSSALFWPDPTSTPVILPPYADPGNPMYPYPAEAHGLNNRGQIVGGCMPYNWVGLIWQVAPPTGPSWPSGSTLTVADLNMGSLTLTWPAATSSSGIIVSYQLFQGAAQIATLPAEVLNYGVIGLTPGASYTFTVKAVDSSGSASSDGLSATVTIPRNPPPSWPPGSTLGLGSREWTGDWTSVIISWPWPTSGQNIREYQVFQGAVQIATVPFYSYQMNWTVTGLTPGTTYTFSVKAVDWDGNASPPLSGTITMPLPGPSFSPVTRLSVDVWGSVNVHLWWDAAVPYNGIPIACYQLFRDGALVGTVYGGPGVYPQYDLYSLPANTTFTFMVKAVDTAGNFSINNLTATVTTGAALPGWPTGSSVSVSNVTYNSVTVSWPPAASSVGIQYYQVWQDGLWMGQVPATSPLTYTAAGLAPSRQYFFEIAAVDTNWYVSPTRLSTTVTTAAIPPPRWPGGSSLSVTDLQWNSLTLSWPAATSVNGVASYQVFQGGVPVATLPSGTQTWSASALSPQTLYNFIVKAVDTTGLVSTDFLSINVTTAVAPPSWPTGSALAVSNLNVTSLTLSWPAAVTSTSGIASYRVFQGGSQIADVPGGTLTYNVTGLTPNTAYTFTVKAQDQLGRASLGDLSTTATTLTVQGGIGVVAHTVAGFVQAGTLGSGTANSMTSKLDAAVTSLAKGNSNAARNQLQLFIEQVRALMKSGRLSSAEGSQLIDQATALIALI